MINLNQLEQAAIESNIGGELKDGSRGRPKSDIEKTKKLLSLTEATHERLAVLKRLYKKRLNEKTTDSEVAEAAIHFMTEMMTDAQDDDLLLVRISESLRLIKIGK